MRLDKELVEKSLVPSRSKAQELIKEGFILVNRKVVDKSNYIVKETDVIEIKENDKLKYVSRGGLKLDKAINEFNIDMTNKRVMDIGSSTGGFSDCALQYGAVSIVAVDVGTNIMHESLRNDSRIDLHEQTNFKEFESSYFKDIDIAVCDVSFISLKRIIDKIASENVSIDMVCLIKPQFECGKELADKYKGIILNKQIHIEIIKDMINYFNEKGFYVKNLSSSPIRGGDGNIEYLTLISNKIDSNKDINIEDLVYNTFKNR
ncbi:MAG: TlyA family RNA methyltransferase [Bacilli bacterium]|nr:TlyA family RNA methyltransferase [Bacilli bacterium]